MILKRWGLRNTLVLGLGVQSLRFLLMVLNPGSGWLLVVLSLNGFVFAFFDAVAMIFVDGPTDSETRGGVHQLMGLIFLGTSSVVGSLVTGLCLDWFAQDGRVDYARFWTVPLNLSFLALILVLAFFSARKS